MRIKKTLTSEQLRRKWRNMIERCHDPRCYDWRNYGARGISVCERWRNSFDDFAKDVGLPPAEGMWLDRVDNDGNYEPDNMRWATVSQQQRNRRNDGNYGRAGLTSEDVRRIESDLRAGVPQRVIAEEHGITRYMVSHIATGRSWGSITGRMCRSRVVC